MENLYRNQKDIAFTPEGDLHTVEYLDESGTLLKDFMGVTGEDHVRQSVLIRLKTNLKEFLLHPQIGNQLNEIIGKRNTRETAELGRAFLHRAILRENFIAEQDLSIETLPSDANAILYIVKVSTGWNETVTMILEMDLQEGIRRLV